MGVPVVLPSNTPDKISTRSDSRRCVVYLDWPGLRRSRSLCKSAAHNASPGGQPSTTPPNAAPWLSPKVVRVNNLPKVLPDMTVAAPVIVARG